LKKFGKNPFVSVGGVARNGWTDGRMYVQTEERTCANL